MGTVPSAYSSVSATRWRTPNATRDEVPARSLPSSVTCEMEPVSVRSSRSAAPELPAAQPRGREQLGPRPRLGLRAHGEGRDAGADAQSCGHLGRLGRPRDGRPSAEPIVAEPTGVRRHAPRRAGPAPGQPGVDGQLQPEGILPAGAASDRPTRALDERVGTPPRRGIDPRVHDHEVRQRTLDVERQGTLPRRADRGRDLAGEHERLVQPRSEAQHAHVAPHLGAPFGRQDQRMEPLGARFEADRLARARRQPHAPPVQERAVVAELERRLLLDVAAVGRHHLERFLTERVLRGRLEADVQALGRGQRDDALDLHARCGRFEAHLDPHAGRAHRWALRS